jgi:hypothetical protein
VDAVGGIQVNVNLDQPGKRGVQTLRLIRQKKQRESYHTNRLGGQMSRVFWGVIAVLAVAATLSAQTTFLNNSSFSVGVAPYGDPANWSVGELGSLTGVWRDTVDFHSAPASLGILRQADGEGGNLNQRFVTLPAAGGQSFTYEAWVKVDSLSGGQVQLVGCFNCTASGWNPCPDGAWMGLARFTAVTSGWTKVTGTATVPAGAVWALIRVWVSGRVACHIDDIKINGQGEPVSVAAPSSHRAAPHRTVLDAADLSGTNRMSMYTPNGRFASAKAGAKSLPTGFYLVKIADPGQQRVLKMLAK